MENNHTYEVNIRAKGTMAEIIECLRAISGGLDTLVSTLKVNEKFSSPDEILTITVHHDEGDEQTHTSIVSTPN